MKAWIVFSMCLVMSGCAKPEEPKKAALADIATCAGFADNLPLPGEGETSLAYASAKNAALSCHVAATGALGTTCSDYVESRETYARELADTLYDSKPSKVQIAREGYAAMHGTTCPAAIS